jgi:hypothetical protein
MVILRVLLYGDPNLSIAGNDTPSFVKSSQVPLFSKEMITGQRLLTTNLIYKAFEPQNGYEILANGSIETTRRVFQLGFNYVAITQLIISILGWGALAFVVSMKIKNKLIRILCISILLLFAFTPQVADWDSILMSESLNFSMFALQLAILIKLVFSFYQDSEQKQGFWLAIWAVLHFLWIFVRPTNLFVAPVTFVAVATLLFIKKYRKNKYLYAILVFTLGIFATSVITTNSSVRSLNYNVYYDDLISKPTRLAILQSWGMPAPDSSDFHPWFQENSTKTLIRFMVTYPGYPATKIINDFPLAFTEIKQTYFKTPDLAFREAVMFIGNALHPENTTPFFMSLILILATIYLAKNQQGSNSAAWAWMGIWLFLTATATLIISIIGDTWGINRHALLSTTIYRLCMWLFAIVIIDIALEKNSQPAQITS